MNYSSQQMEEQAVLATAARMCAAARTAPKTRGKDNILTLVLTGAEKEALAAKMESNGHLKDGGSSFLRDAKSVRASQAVVMIGVKRAVANLAVCTTCGFGSCKACDDAGGRCIFNGVDLGIAVGSAVAVAADDRVDNRIMFTIGKVARDMGYTEEKDAFWQGIPLSVSGKNIFFDR